VTYEESLAYISKLGRFGMKLGTERTRAILDHLGNPERGLRGALIAGTNGKGSTAACLASILQAAGRNVCFMPKPHLISYTERIQVNGVPISEQDFVATLEGLKPGLDAIAKETGQATEFEMLTAMAIDYLAPRIDRLVCEVGLGGRLDATNALDLGVAMITNVDLDHQKYLGDTIEQIAHEKAAIIKPGNHVITGCEGVALEIVQENATNAGSSLWRLGREIRVTSTSRGWDGHSLDVTVEGHEYRNLTLPLVGDYQPANAALAVAAAVALGDATEDSVRRGLASTVWPGRLLLAALRKMNPDAVVFTEPGSAGGHAIAAAQLADLYGPGAQAVTPAFGALERARELAGRDGNVLVCGSLYLVGEILAQTSQISGR